MRPLLAITISCVLLGGTWAYLRFAASVHRDPAPYRTELADEIYTLEVLRTSALQPGPKIPGLSPNPSLNPTANSQSKSTSSSLSQLTSTHSLKITFNGEPVYLSNSELPPDEALTIPPLNNVEVGLNEVFLSANIQPPVPSLAAVQLRIKQADRIIAESTFTSVPGSTLVYGVVVFEVKSKEELNSASRH